MILVNRHFGTASSVNNVFQSPMRLCRHWRFPAVNDEFLPSLTVSSVTYGFLPSLTSFCRHLLFSSVIDEFLSSLNFFFRHWRVPAVTYGFLPALTSFCRHWRVLSSRVVFCRHWRVLAVSDGFLPSLTDSFRHWRFSFVSVGILPSQKCFFVKIISFCCH